MKRLRKAPARRSQALRPVAAFIDCPGPVCLLGTGFGVLCAIAFLIALGVLW